MRGEMIGGGTRHAIARFTWVPAIAVTSVLIFIAYGPARLGYDALFALIWGRQLSRLELPDVGVAEAPTPHPLANLVGALLAPLGAHAAATVMATLACVAFGAAAYAAWLLGRRLFGWGCGLLFGLLVLTSPGLVVGLLYASTDLWFLALVLFAGAQVARRPSATSRALLTLALAGLLRPEAWALSAVYAGVLTRSRASRRTLLGAGALMLAAPVIWMALDWIWAGDPLHSLRATRELAAALERPRGLGAAMDLGAEYLAGLLGEPVLWAGLAGCMIAVALTPERAVLPAAVLLVGTAGFAILALAGLPLIERYVVLPAAALALFAAAAVLGWRVLAPGSARRAWAAGGITALVLGALLAPAQVRQLADVRELAGQQRERQLALRAFAARMRDAPARCTIQAPSSQDAQAIVLFGDLDRRQILPTGRQPRPADLRVVEGAEAERAIGRTLARAGGLVLVADRRGRC